MIMSVTQATQRIQDQPDGEIGHVVVENIWRIGDVNPFLLACSYVNAVRSHAGSGHDFHSWQAGQHRCLEARHPGRYHATNTRSDRFQKSVGIVSKVISVRSEEHT